MQRNFLKGVMGEYINAVMHGAAFNCRKYMRQLFALAGYAKPMAASDSNVGYAAYNAL